MEDTYQVIVVGAGFAGMTAAKELGPQGRQRAAHRLQQLSPVPAAPVPGGDVPDRRVGHRAAASVRFPPDPEGQGAHRGSGRSRCSQPHRHHRRGRHVPGADPGHCGRRRAELLQYAGRGGACLPAVFGHRRDPAGRQADPAAGPGRPGVRRLCGRGRRRRRPHGRGDRWRHGGKRQVRGAQVLFAGARSPLPRPLGGHDPDRTECVLGEVAGLRPAAPDEDRRPAASGSRRHGGPGRRRDARRRDCDSRPGGGVGRRPEGRRDHCRLRPGARQGRTHRCPPGPDRPGFRGSVCPRRRRQHDRFDRSQTAAAGLRGAAGREVGGRATSTPTSPAVPGSHSSTSTRATWR